MKYLVNTSFDGTNYYGTQKQPNKKTIIGTLETPLSKITNENIKLTACSRLDKGVHAHNFYFTFITAKNIDTTKLKKSLNELTPEDIYIKEIKEVSNEFHARYDVQDKEYMYIINTGEYTPTKRNIELEYNKPINIKLIKKASKYLIGTHDFKAFTSNDEKENYIRTIHYIKIKQEKEIIRIYIKGNGFLKYMIRNIIGLFLDINENKINIKEIKNILNKRDRSLLGTKALPNGLYLNKVNYK